MTGNIETIELNFDVQLNTMMVRYYQLNKTYDYLGEDGNLDANVKDFLIDNIAKEIEHMSKILNQEIPNELKKQ